MGIRPAKPRLWKTSGQITNKLWREKKEVKRTIWIERDLRMDRYQAVLLSKKGKMGKSS